jgi:hypothetical protein
VPTLVASADRAALKSGGLTSVQVAVVSVVVTAATIFVSLAVCGLFWRRRVRNEGEKERKQEAATIEN